MDMDMIEKEEYFAHTEYLMKASEKFEGKLTQDLREEWKKLMDEEMKADEILHRDGFCRGFQLGLRLAAETFMK